MSPEENRKKAIELLDKLTVAHGAAGCEDTVRHIFRAELNRTVRTDRMGNMFCEIEGTSAAPRIMLTAHMDEVGFVVQAITKKGLLKFMPLGGWWPHTILAQRVRILTQEGKEITGLIGAKPPHFLSAAEREKVLNMEDMFIDIGAESGEEVRNRFGVRLGDSIVPESSFTQLNDTELFMGKAFDNRVGMALLIHVMSLLEQISHPNTVCGTATVQEEVGTRGAQTAPFSVDPDLAVILEGTPADDLPAVAEDEQQGVLGRGVQVRLMDPSAIMNRHYARYVLQVAESNGIAHQVAVRKSGGTDAKAIHLHGRGVPSIVLGVPARYIHTHNSIIHMQDYLSALELVLKLLPNLDDQTLSGFTDFAR